MTITNGLRWSLGGGKTLVPSRWHATDAAYSRLSSPAGGAGRVGASMDGVTVTVASQNTSPAPPMAKRPR